MTSFILVGIKIHDTETPLLPIPVDFNKQPETQDLGGAAQHLEGLIIKKTL